MTARDFEQVFFTKEGFVIVLRCDKEKEVGDYNYDRAARNDMTLSEFKSIRLASLPVQYVIYDGEVQEPHGRTKLSSIRSSYKK